MLDQITDLVNQDPWLQRKGRFVTTTLMVELSDETGPERFRMELSKGRIVAVQREAVDTARFIMPQYDLSLKAPRSAWFEFWKPLPRAGFHDLFALRKRRLLHIEGNLQPFMANLFYFKGLLEAPRRLAQRGVPHA